jgi:hypothetical protein
MSGKGLRSFFSFNENTDWGWAGQIGFRVDGPLLQLTIDD